MTIRKSTLTLDISSKSMNMAELIFGLYVLGWFNDICFIKLTWNLVKYFTDIHIEG